MVKRITEEEYDLRIAAHGKVARLESFKGMSIKILHICLKHNETMPGSPRSLAKGHGLYCCKLSVIANKKSKETFDQKIKELGKVKRVGEYVNTRTKILFKCIEHGEIYPSTPADILKGHGLACCSSPNLKNKNAKDSFDEKMKKLGRVERIGEYINSHTRIEFRCLHHDEVHLSTPSDILSGRGLSCCKSNRLQELNSLLLQEKDTRDACVYLYKLSNFAGYLKLGISSHLNLRVKDYEYGEFISSWHSSSRLECYCVEQAALKDVILTRSCPDKLLLLSWKGYTEVLKSSEETTINVIQYYWNLMQKLGPYKFALDYLNPRHEDRRLLLEKVGTACDGSVC